MATRIRLARFGAKKDPYYRIIIADIESPRDGRFIEQIGTYNPKKETDKVVLKEERAKYWLKQGAQPTNTVYNIFKQLGLIDKKN